MSPRPIEFPEPEFGEALLAARAGRCGEALRAIEGRLAEDAEREQRAGAAATALAEVSRLAQAAGDPVAADRSLELALQLRPRYADLHFQRACLLLARQRRAEARESLDAALRLNPGYRAARLERALLDAREGRVAEALDELRAMAREAPIEDAGAFQAGIRSLERAESEEAEPLLKRAMDLSAPDLRQRLEGVRAHLERGEAVEAIAALRAILHRHERYPDLHHLLGLAELRLGRFDDAIASLAHALELNPDFHDARVLLAQALDGVGERGEAARQVALVLEQEPSHRLALELKAAWSERVGASEAAGRRPRPRRAA